MSFRSAGTPDKSTMLTYYPFPERESVCDRMWHLKLELVEEIYATRKRVLRMVGGRELSDEEIASIKQNVLNGRARMVRNLYFKP